MTEAHIKVLFHTYRSTPDFEYKGLAFSPTCMQVCRPIPSFAATTREQIVQHQKDADAGNIPTDDTNIYATRETVSEPAEVRSNPKLFYTIHPISVSSASFGTLESCAAINCTPSQLQRQAEDEDWMGMRVDLWDEGEDGLLVKVQYWWREEDEEGSKVLRQCLHDIVYLGPKDGTEGSDGLEVLERGW
jgi:hypothetical protein